MTRLSDDTLHHIMHRFTFPDFEFHTPRNYHVPINLTEQFLVQAPPTAVIEEIQKQTDRGMEEFKKDNPDVKVISIALIGPTTPEFGYIVQLGWLIHYV